MYSPFVDPYHVTLLYDTKYTEWYEDLFDNYLGDKSWEIHSKGIYVGPWRVPTLVELTPEQMVWYKMQDESIPHVSLGLHVELTDLEALDMVLLVNPNPNPESAEFMEEKKRDHPKLSGHWQLCPTLFGVRVPLMLA